MNRQISTDIPQRLDRLPWSQWHWMIVLALGVTWILDGLEVTIVGALGPILKHPETLNLTDAHVGLTASAYLLGTVVGALVFSYLIDRQGRKRWFMITLLVYLAATVLTAFSWDLNSFLLFRFLTGLGIGGEYSAINSAIDELIPARNRGHTDIAINGSWWIGTALGALISIPLLDPSILPIDIGWRACFVLGGVLGIAVLLVRRYVPESPRWLILQGREDEAEEIVRAVEQNYTARGIHLTDIEAHGNLTFNLRRPVTIFEAAREILQVYPRRATLGIALMMGQSFLYNAIFFTYALVLTRYYGVADNRIGLYLLPFALSNFLGPLLLGAILRFDRS